MSDVRAARLDGRQRTKWAVLQKLKRDLRLPAHFGRNLDALHDSLTTDVPGPVTIRWRATPATKRALDDDYDEILRTLEGAAAVRADLMLQVR